MHVFFLASDIAEDLRKLILELHDEFLSPDGLVSISFSFVLLSSLYIYLQVYFS